MEHDAWTLVDTYMADRLILPDPVLDAALAASDAAGLRPAHVAPNQGKLLMLLAQIQGATSILELGTLAGYSTIWLARALPQGGKLVTIELDPAHAEVAKKNIASAGLSELVEFRVGKALEVLTELIEQKAGPFDFIFLDADKAPSAEYFELALWLSRPGTVIVADNVVREGAILDAASEDPSVQGTRRLFDELERHPKVTATALQTVGSKGYDGFAIIVVN